MVAVYKETQREEPRMTNRPLTTIVIALPSSQDHQTVGPVPEVRVPIAFHAEDEPTWEDAAWV